MSDEVLSPDEQIIRDMGDEMNEIRVGRAKAYFQIRRLRTQLAEANTRIETLTHRLEAANERAEAWEEAALGKAGKLEFDEMERSWRETVVRAEEVEAERDELKRQLAAERKQRVEAEAERDALYRKATDEVWYWQGDGYDIPESLACPVLMDADTLRDLLGRVAMRGERDQLAAEGVMLRDALNVALNTEHELCGSEDRIAMYEAALAATPNTAKAAERVKAMEAALRAAHHEFTTLHGLWACDNFDAYDQALADGCDHNAAWKRFCDEMWQIDTATPIEQIDNALAATPNTAKAAERVKATGDVLKIARTVISHITHVGFLSATDWEKLEQLRDALDRLDALDVAGRVKVRDIVGLAPGFTGELPSEEYVRQMRDEDAPDAAEQTCSTCGRPMQDVRPGKWQCPRCE